MTPSRFPPLQVQKKCISSNFVRLKVILTESPQERASQRFAYSQLQLSYRLSKTVTSAMSSAYAKQCKGLPSQSIRAMQSIKRISKIKEPQGSLHQIRVSEPVRLFSWIFTDQEVAKEQTYYTKFFSQPCFLSLCTSLLGRTLLKAPLISSIRRVALCLLLSASFILCIKQVIRFTAKQSGKALKCQAKRTQKVIAS